MDRVDLCTKFACTAVDAHQPCCTLYSKALWKPFFAEPSLEPFYRNTFILISHDTHNQDGFSTREGGKKFACIVRGARDASIFLPQHFSLSQILPSNCMTVRRVDNGLDESWVWSIGGRGRLRLRYISVYLGMSNQYIPGI
jgi:hypothetical protein